VNIKIILLLASLFSACGGYKYTGDGVFSIGMNKEMMK